MEQKNNWPSSKQYFMLQRTTRQFMNFTARIQKHLYCIPFVQSSDMFKLTESFIFRIGVCSPHELIETDILFMIILAFKFVHIKEAIAESR